MRNTKVEPPAAELRIGERLRANRERAGLSQRALAKKVGVGNATISLIEQDKLNPSVGLLKRVLDGIPLSIAEFFSQQDAPRPQIFYARADFTEISSQRGISFRQLGRRSALRQLQILSETYQPRADTGVLRLQHEGQEGGVVLRGRLEVTVGDETRVLRAGDGYYFDSSTPHRFRNVGDEPCRVISACTPPTF
jgi:transcriptional regulator with XRE-family HTH domain